MVKAIVMGAGGKMGGRTASIVNMTDGIEIAAAVEKAGHPVIGQDVGETLGLGKKGVPIVAGLEAAIGKGDVIIDFTHHGASVGHVASLSRASLSGASSLNGGVEDEKVAALVLSANRGCALDVANFVNKLDGTQFLFMSSCRSADSYVVAHAAKEHIPAVLGFRWTVGDKSAAAFADAFYRRLFSRGGGSYKFLEYAFRDARKFTYHKDVNDPTWASPVLMMQMRELAQIA